MSLLIIPILKFLLFSIKFKKTLSLDRTPIIVAAKI